MKLFQKTLKVLQLGGRIGLFAGSTSFPAAKITYIQVKNKKEMSQDGKWIFTGTGGKQYDAQNQQTVSRK